MARRLAFSRLSRSNTRRAASRMRSRFISLTASCRTDLSVFVTDRLPLLTNNLTLLKYLYSNFLPGRISMLMTAQEYRDSLRKYNPRVFINGRKIDSVADEPLLA